MRTRIKICGVTRPEDGALADQLGADFVGLVFASSPRQLDIGSAGAILNQIHWARPVGLFMNQPEALVAEILAALPQIELAQFHGMETPQYCRSFGIPYIKALSLADPSLVADAYPDAAAWLFDTHAGKKAGGSGESFDWNLLPSDSQQPVMLAGGLSADNVAVAIDQIGPFAVDVSSGVEQSPGIKDPQRLKAFFAEVNRVNCSPEP